MNRTSASTFLHPASTPAQKLTLPFYLPVYTVGMFTFKSISYPQGPQSADFHSPSVTCWLGEATEKHTLLARQQLFPNAATTQHSAASHTWGHSCTLPIFSKILKPPDLEFCGTLACFTGSLSSFNSSSIYILNSCIYCLLSPLCTGGSHYVT